MKYFLIILLVLLQGCSKYSSAYDVTDKKYLMEQEAAVDFFESNYEVLKKLRSEQEMLGWILMCNGLYRVTDYKIGTASNHVNTRETFNGCVKIAFMHSHPHPPPEMTTDFFSKADLEFAKGYPLYMMAQESCFLRYADVSTRSARGEFISTVNCPKRVVKTLR